MNKRLPVVIRAASLWGHNLGEEWFIWAHGFREFSSWSFGSLFLGLSWGRPPDGRTILREILFTLVWTQSVVRIGLRNTSFSDTSPSNPFPQIKAHLVKFCVSPEITLLAGDSKKPQRNFILKPHHFPKALPLNFVTLVVKLSTYRIWSGISKSQY